MCLYLAALLGLYFLFRWHRERQTVPNIANKYVLITGCDSGFGNLLARQLDQRGMRVLAACLTQKGAEQLKEAASQRLQTVILDVADGDSVVVAAQWVKQQVGENGLWGLVNNAGIAQPTAPNGWLKRDDFVRVLNVNLLGTIDVTLNLLPLLRQARGRIVNVASIMGRVSCSGGGYSISKFGVEAFSDSLRRELRAFGVKVSVIEPGQFRTAIMDTQSVVDNLQRVWSRVPQEIKKTYGEHYLKAYCDYARTSIASGSEDLTLVTNCMEHGLTALHPRTRYSVGWDAKFFYIPISYLPTAMADYLLAPSVAKSTRRN
ncbi:retinol dehydrogenase 7-like [Ambystoma mexicanum]|uniref:retinol dehydrogenase 7-like n=1 Tax=Ambystoma mexicanum TaxID=8296 RepID=UPI0037E83FCF